MQCILIFSFVFNSGIFPFLKNSGCDSLNWFWDLLMVCNPQVEELWNVSYKGYGWQHWASSSRALPEQAFHSSMTTHFSSQSNQPCSEPKLSWQSAPSSLHLNGDVHAALTELAGMWILSPVLSERVKASLCRKLHVLQMVCQHFSPRLQKT